MLFLRRGRLKELKFLLRSRVSPLPLILSCMLILSFPRSLLNLASLHLQVMLWAFTNILNLLLLIQKGIGTKIKFLYWRNIKQNGIFVWGLCFKINHLSSQAGDHPTYPVPHTHMRFLLPCLKMIWITFKISLIWKIWSYSHKPFFKPIGMLLCYAWRLLVGGMLWSWVILRKTGINARASVKLCNINFLSFRKWSLPFMKRLAVLWLFGRRWKFMSLLLFQLSGMLNSNLPYR